MTNQQKLDRYRYLVSLGKTDELHQLGLSELRALQSELVEKYLPIVDALARSGLLNLSVGELGGDDVEPSIKFIHEDGKQMASVEFEAKEAFENGSITIHGNAWEGGTFKK